MLAPESNLGTYRLIARIGAGGMGEVWKAEDMRLGRIVAIKILPAEVASNPDAAARMRREARTAAQLYHPNIAMIHSFEQDGDRLFIVMEYVDGQPLSAVLKRGPMSEADICRIGRGVADALAEAHAKGIVHRDIKPDNIIVTAKGVKVLDFGIAKQVGITPEAPSGDAPTTFVTKDGMIVGTIQYMSPEQALGKDLDARTDIFSFGVVLYQAATGRLPFRGETVTDTMTQIIRDEPEDPQRVNPQLSPGLAGVIRRCMAKKREQRFASAEELAHALNAQMGKIATAPYTLASEPTVARTAAATTMLTEAKPARKGAYLAVAVVLALIAGAAAAVLLANRHPQATAPAPVPPKPVVTTTTAAPPPTTTVTVTAAPQIVEKSETHAPVPVPAPVPAPQPPPPPTNDPRPTTNEARDHLRLGQVAMMERRFNVALDEYNAALAQNDQLDEREQMFARLGVAISSHKRFEAQSIAVDINERYPDDAELRGIVKAFPGLFLGARQNQGRGRRFHPH